MQRKSRFLLTRSDILNTWSREEGLIYKCCPPICFIKLFSSCFSWLFAVLESSCSLGTQCLCLFCVVCEWLWTVMVSGNFLSLLPSVWDRASCIPVQLRRVAAFLMLSQCWDYRSIDMCHSSWLTGIRIIVSDSISLRCFELHVVSYIVWLLLKCNLRGWRCSRGRPYVGMYEVLRAVSSPEKGEE